MKRGPRRTLNVSPAVFLLGVLLGGPLIAADGIIENDAVWRDTSQWR
jgi:hypothetical protein